ncbi:MAG: alpha/beta hydrolase [Pseudomonadota bacterium]
MGRSLARKAGRIVFLPGIPHHVARTRLDKGAERSPPASSVTIRDEAFAGLPALRFEPDASRPGALLYLHGGGYIVGSRHSHGPFVSHLAKAWRLNAVSPDYRLAPEHPCPAGLEDALGAFRALRAEADGPVVLAGDSAGAGLALATSLALREAGEVGPDALVLFSPWADLTMSGASVRERAAADVMLTPAGLSAAAELYRGDLPADDPRVSPIFADLSGLGPVFIQTGEDEILLDDTLRLHERFEAAGVEVTTEIWRGVWHDFQMFGPIVPEARAAIGGSGQWVSARLDAMKAERS